MDDDKSEFNQSIGAVLQQKRKTIGWSREQMSRRSGIQFQDIYCYEHGRRGMTLRTFLHLCRVLDISFRDKSSRLSGRTTMAGGLPQSGLRCRLGLAP